MDAESNDTGACTELIGCAIKTPSIDDSLVARLPDNARIFDVGIGNFTPKAVARARERGLRIYRFDSRAGLSSMVLRLLETDDLVRRKMGRIEVKGVEIVAGGLLGAPGAIVVDSINDPAYLIGVADGCGNLKSELTTEDHENMAFVSELIGSS